MWEIFKFSCHYEHYINFRMNSTPGCRIDGLPWFDTVNQLLSLVRDSIYDLKLFETETAIIIQVNVTKCYTMEKGNSSAQLHLSLQFFIKNIFGILQNFQNHFNVKLNVKFMCEISVNFRKCHLYLI